MVTAINGSSFFARDAAAPTRLDPLAKQFANSLLLQWGGVSELIAEFTGAELLTVAENYANARRDAGFGRIIGLTIPHSLFYNSTMNGHRLDYNAALLESPVFDAVADIAAEPEMADGSDTTYFLDGTHFTDQGAEVVAAKVATVLGVI